MSTFTIPTIYTAVDKFSAPVKAMERANASFGAKLDSVSAKSERMFKKLTPGLSDATKQMVSMASSAALVGAAIGGIAFSGKSLMDYEDALQKFRTIVSDLSNEDFSKFEKSIGTVAKATGKSTIEVANSFEMIAGLNADFAKTADGLSLVSKAAITLSKASKDELGVSASNLVGILNQFSLGANEADRVINVLAAGQAVGASSITQTAEAFTVFGAVAKQSNLSLEQSVALTEVLAAKQIMGSEAGTALRGTLVRLKASGLGYKNGLFNTRDALEEVNAKYAKLKTAKEKDALLDKIFGTINLTTGSILMENVKKFDEFTGSVTATKEAEKAATINSSTLSEMLNKLKNSWVTMLTSSDGAKKGMNKVKNVIKYVTDNLDELVSIGINVIKFFALWKIANIGMKGLMLANNILLGVQNALKLESIALIKGNVIATKASIITEKAMAAAIAISTGNMAALNAVMMANPIGALIIALGALALAVYGVNKAIEIFDEPLNKSFERKEQLRQEAFSVIELRDNYLALGKTLKEAERMAVGKAAIGVQSSIIAAKMQLASVDPEERQKGVEAIASIGNRASQLKNFMNGGFQKDYGQKFANSMDTKSFVGGIGTSQEVGQYDWINPKQAQSQATATEMIKQKGEMKVIFENAPPGTKAEQTSNSNMNIGAVVTSTMSAAK